MVRSVYGRPSPDRHLEGAGGIGKTSLTLAVVSKIGEIDRFSVIVWFSARDIDLLTSGAKSVKPRILNEADIGELYCK